MCALSW